MAAKAQTYVSNGIAAVMSQRGIGSMAALLAVVLDWRFGAVYFLTAPFALFGLHSYGGKAGVALILAALVLFVLGGFSAARTVLGRDLRPRRALVLLLAGFAAMILTSLALAKPDDFLAAAGELFIGLVIALAAAEGIFGTSSTSAGSQGSQVFSVPPPGASGRSRRARGDGRVAEWMIRFYEQHMTMARHHDGQRSHVGNLLFTLDAGLLALLGVLVSRSNSAGFPILGASAPLVGLTISGTFGALFSAKQFERSKYHLSQAGNFERRIFEVAGDTRLESRTKTTIYEQKEKWPFTNRLHLYKLWVGLHWAVAAAGGGALFFWTIFPN